MCCVTQVEETFQKVGTVMATEGLQHGDVYGDVPLEPPMIACKKGRKLKVQTSKDTSANQGNFSVTYLEIGCAFFCTLMAMAIKAQKNVQPLSK